MRWMIEIHVISIDLDVYCIDVPNVLLFSFVLSHSTARGVKDNKCFRSARKEVKIPKSTMLKYCLFAALIANTF